MSHQLLDDENVPGSGDLFAMAHVVALEGKDSCDRLANYVIPDEYDRDILRDKLLRVTREAASWLQDYGHVTEELRQTVRVLQICRSIATAFKDLLGEKIVTAMNLELVKLEKDLPEKILKQAVDLGLQLTSI